MIPATQNSFEVWHVGQRRDDDFMIMAFGTRNGAERFVRLSAARDDLEIRDGATVVRPARGPRRSTRPMLKLVTG